MAAGRPSVAATLRAARPSAASAARWTSCPHACIAPFADAQGTPVCSTTGRASSSALTATHGPSAGPILTSLPVPATWGASGSPSASATLAAVWYSDPDSSGAACSSRRSRTASASSRSSAARSAAAKPDSADASPDPAGAGGRPGHRSSRRYTRRALAAPTRCPTRSASAADQAPSATNAPVTVARSRRNPVAPR